MLSKGGMHPNTAEDWDEEPTWPGRATPPARVLVIDDDDGSSHRVIARLERDGYEVHRVTSGARAIAVAETADLIVGDLQHAGSSVLEIVRTLRSRGWQTPAVLISSFADPGLTDAVSVLGIRLLLKPFALERLSDLAIASLLEAS